MGLTDSVNKLNNDILNIVTNYKSLKDTNNVALTEVKVLKQENKSLKTERDTVKKKIEILLVKMQQNSEGK